jgi:hypothetical protein
MGQINAALKNVSDTFQQGGGSVAGGDYQTLVRNLSPLFNSAEPDVRAAGWRIKNMLDQRAQSVMTQPQINDFNAANSQYRANKTLQSVAGSDGKFTPGDLYNETQLVSKNYGNSTGVLDRLAQTGNTVIQPTLDTGLGTVGRIGATGLGGAGVAGVSMAALQKALTLDLLTSGVGATALTGAGLLGNRILQGQNYSGGPRAIATSLRGGGPPTPGELQQALAVLRPVTRAAVSQSVQQQNATP